MRTKSIAIAVLLAWLACHQQSHAQSDDSPAGYASAGLAERLTQSAAWQELGDDEPLGEDSGCDCSYGGGCDSCAGCDSCGCDSCGSCSGCGCAPSWQIFGDFLFLRPRDAEVVYAVPFNGPVTSPPDVPIQVGPLGLTDYDYESAYRAGFSRALDDCASLGVTFTQFETSTRESIHTAAPYAIRSMVSHPSTLSANSDGLDAAAVAALDFDLVDLDFRGVITCSERHTLNYLVGARYAYLEQNFFSRYAVNGIETVAADIYFDGGGIRVGLEGERYACNCGLMIYGRGIASFVAGEFETRYIQDHVFAGNHVVDTRWKAGRAMSILDLEVGAGWTSPSGRLRLSGGYMFSAWYNAVKTADFIQAVRGNSFVGLGDRLTFDGLVARVEYRF